MHRTLFIHVCNANSIKTKGVTSRSSAAVIYMRVCVTENSVKEHLHWNIYGCVRITYHWTIIITRAYAKMAAARFSSDVLQM